MMPWLPSPDAAVITDPVPEPLPAAAPMPPAVPIPGEAAMPGMAGPDPAGGAAPGVHAATPPPSAASSTAPMSSRVFCKAGPLYFDGAAGRGYPGASW